VGKKLKKLFTNHKIYLVYYFFLFSSIAHSIGSFDWGTENLESIWGGMTMPCYYVCSTLQGVHKGFISQILGGSSYFLHFNFFQNTSITCYLGEYFSNFNHQPSSYI
jgi:hypothetical protein